MVSDRHGERTHHASVSIEDGTPVLEVDGAKIRLRVFFEREDEAAMSPFGEHVDLDVEKDYDADNGCWWNLTPEGEEWPLITLQPEVAWNDE